MVALKSLAKIDLHLQQAFPSSSDNFFGGISVLLFGDFGQLPLVGNTPLFGDLSNLGGDALDQALQGKLAYFSFEVSTILSIVMRQGGNDQEQIKFRDLLLRLWDRCCMLVLMKELDHTLHDSMHMTFILHI